MPKTVMPADRGIGAVMSSRAPIRPRGGVKAASRRRIALRTEPDAPRARLVEIQRARMLGAALGVVDELGYSSATVAHVTTRARVSRRTFYDVFDNREDCLLAALESVVARIGDELSAVSFDALSWREGVRAGLWTILSFFDREPALARVCFVQALRGGPRVLERREQVLATLAHVVDRGREENNKGRTCPPLMADGLVGAAFGIVYGRLLRGERDPLTDLFGELMGIMVLPYLGPAAAHREQRLATPAAAGEQGVRSGSVRKNGYAQDPLAELPMRLTYRTALVLEVLAASPGISNRVVGERSGVPDQGQISRLLARLERLGLAENTGEGHTRGEANAWTLTATGGRVAQSIGAHTERRRTDGVAA
jgi:AcrR family transcriptional regulator/DNA-binding MarR family transcriptional regulator